MVAEQPREPDHAEIMYALGALHSDLKHVAEDVRTMKKVQGVNAQRITSLETSRTRLWAYASGLSVGVFALGSFLKDKLLQ
jgi:hypothetical protein